MRQPLVSVIIAVYNETELLLRCIDSILRQSWLHLEVIIADDGSSEPTLAILRNLDDPRIRVFYSPERKGQSAARNLAIRNAAGEYIAIMDADDFCHPHRIEKQVQFLELHPETDVLGTGFHAENGASWPLYTNAEDIRMQLLINNPLVHSSAMIRRSSLTDDEVYRSAFDRSEDYDLFARHAKDWKMENLPVDLVTYHIRRAEPEAFEDQREKARKIRELLALTFGISLSQDAWAAFHSFCELTPGVSAKTLNSVFQTILNSDIQKMTSKVHRILYRHLILYALQTGEKMPVGMILTGLQQYPALIPAFIKSKVKRLYT